MPISRRQLLLAGGTAVSTALLSRGWAAETDDSRAGYVGGAPHAAGAGTITIGADLTVNRLGFGALSIVTRAPYGPPKDAAQMRRVLRWVVDLGVNFIDTADAYGPHLSEELIKAALHPYPAGLVIATKGGLIRPGREPGSLDGRPVYLRRACESSMARLGVERIDLYQLHAVDPQVPLEESVGELGELRKEGKIHHIGVSNVSLEQLQRARKVAPIASVQNRYNYSDRSADEVLRYCEAEGLVFIPWDPLGRGGPADVTARLAKVARRRGISPEQGALAWLLARSKQVLPIPGTTALDHLLSNIAAGSIRLTPEDLREIG
jgi:aryl-alcohol dehydrogenase-like predicted oxidoreductase